MPPHIFDPDLQLLPVLERLFGLNRLIFGRLIDTDEKGIPYIDDWFQQGIDLSDSDLVVWINGDIIIPNGWFPRVRYVYDRFSKLNRQFAILCRRCDFNISLSNLSNFFNSVSQIGIDPNVQWPPDFDAIAANRVLHTTWGMDIFVISMNVMELNFDEMPPFHMGR
jgi:hypothetical protein